MGQVLHVSLPVSEPLGLAKLEDNDCENGRSSDHSDPKDLIVAFPLMSSLFFLLICEIISILLIYHMSTLTLGFSQQLVLFGPHVFLGPVVLLLVMARLRVLWDDFCGGFDAQLAEFLGRKRIVDGVCLGVLGRRGLQEAEENEYRKEQNLHALKYI